MKFYPVLRFVLFLLPAETAHTVSMFFLKLICRTPLRNMIRKYFEPENAQSINLWNLTFKNPVGLAAGFDKNAKYLSVWEMLGFGFVEVGTITLRPQKGNPKPRLFRLPADKALINRMGFNNDGAKVIAERLKNWRIKHRNTSLIIGANIGKNKDTPNEEAWQEYGLCFQELHPYVDYFVVNVSSPNTPGLRELQEKESLKKILTHLQRLNQSFDLIKPILLKIAPDLNRDQIDQILELANEIQLDGIVATNTTIGREGLSMKKQKVETCGAGGLSGRPLKKISTSIVKYISQKTKGNLPIIASGGIFTAQDAKEKKEAGATLIQLWTGFVYEGPGVLKRVCKYL
ncbi:MAG: quinone-dependent dihydroorotate dehydrogenase [Chitinophagaceae bacterium]|nr:quinone-dependent dihydroorotate dehydrogenase [Chitinophagaceae bacterium]